MTIKSLSKHFSLLLALCAMVFITSCGSDDDIVIVPVEGINVANGFYMAADGQDPTTAHGLVSETVEDDGFASQDRTGFMAGYIYMTAGDYTLVEITDKAVTKTIGGTATVITDDGSGCDYNDYTLVATEDDGAAIGVQSDGLYKVTYDEMTGEMILYQIQTAGLIGSATEGGWGSDTALPGSVSASGGSFSAENVLLTTGEYKVRFNCRWNLNRLIDQDLTGVERFFPSNGYQLFTNLGGAAADLAPGNDMPNIPLLVENEGYYTVTLNWDPITGFTSLGLEKTGEAPDNDFVADEHEWALTGSATPNGWADDDPDNDPIGVDHDMNYEGFNAGTYTWVLASIDLVPGAFKFRTNDLWDENIGWEQVTLTGDVSDFGGAGGAGSDITVTTAATYSITLFTMDAGLTYTAEFTEL